MGDFPDKSVKKALPNRGEPDPVNKMEPEQERKKERTRLVEIYILRGMSEVPIAWCAPVDGDWISVECCFRHALRLGKKLSRMIFVPREKEATRRRGPGGRGSPR